MINQLSIITMEIDPKKVPVMKNYCKTCPFKPDSKGKWQDVKLASEVVARTFFQAHQICHGTEGENREPTHLNSSLEIADKNVAKVIESSFLSLSKNKVSFKR